MSAQTSRAPRPARKSARPPAGTQLLLSEELLGEWKAAFDARADAIESDREALRAKRAGVPEERM